MIMMVTATVMVMVMKVTMEMSAALGYRTIGYASSEAKGKRLCFVDLLDLA